MHVAYSSDAVPAKVARIKKHPLMLELVDRYLDRLLTKSRNWFLQQLARSSDPELDNIKANLEAVRRFEDLIKILNAHPDFVRDIQPESRKISSARLLSRFSDHATDLHAILTGRASYGGNIGAEKNLFGKAPPGTNSSNGKRSFTTGAVLILPIRGFSSGFCSERELQSPGPVMLI